MFSVSNMIGRELKAAQCHFMAEAISHSFTGTEPAVFVFVVQPCRLSKLNGLERSVIEGYLKTTDCPGARTLDIWEMTQNPLFSISFPMQTWCQINQTYLLCEKGSVAIKVFAFNTKIEKLSTKKKKRKSLKMRLLTKKRQGTIVKELSDKKRIQYYFREVRFDPSHAAVLTNVQCYKLVTYHHIIYCLKSCHNKKTCPELPPKNRHKLFEIFFSLSGSSMSQKLTKQCLLSSQKTINSE